MARPSIEPSGVEVTFSPTDIIVSKTNLKGVITYANQTFQDISGYNETELIGQPHNLIRHPKMPACIFDLLWKTIQDQKEIFAYVLNLAKNGSHYWVLAHVTPSYNLSGNHVGYHSNRRVPYPDALAKVIPLYEALLEEEQKYRSPSEGIQASSRMIQDTLKSAGSSYSEFVFSLSENTLFDSVCNQATT